MKHWLLLLPVLWASTSDAQSLVSKSDLDTLRTWMCGSFSSQAQSTRDTAYTDVHLNVNAVWPHRIDGLWLYAEQSLSSNLGQPYSQLVYHLFRLNDTTIVNQTYDLVNPSRVVGAWHNAKLFEPLHTDSLRLQVGCAVMLRKASDGSYSGKTPDQQCATTVNGAAYITTEIKIYPDRLLLWERGFDVNGRQVTGSASGAYEFVKE